MTDDSDVWACRKPAALEQEEKDKLLDEYGDLQHREAYFGLSTCPISHAKEQLMEQVALNEYIN